MKTGKSLAAGLLAAAILLALSACQKEGPAEAAGKEVDKAVEQATDSVEQLTDEAGKKLEQAGQKIKGAAKGNH